MKLAWMGVSSVLLGVLACGGSADDDDGARASSSAPGSSSTGTGAASSSASAGAAGNSGGDGSGGDVAQAGAGGMGEGGGSSGGSGGTGNVTEVCAAMQLIVASGPVVQDAGNDGHWSPGESATITVTLTNQAAEDNMFYPGVEIVSDHPGVTSGSPNWLFGIFAGESTPVPVLVEAAADVPVGTVVNLEATVVTINEACAGLSSVQFQATID